MRKIACIILSLFLFLSMSFSEEIRYTENSLARLSCTTGSTFIQRAGDLGYEEGVVNMPVAEGDRVNTTEGRAEIHLGNSNYVRLDFHTKVDFSGLPSIDNDIVQIKLWTGNIILSLGSLQMEKSIEIHTADISLYILDKGTYRININENKSTDFFVYQGIAEAAGESESILLKDGQKLEAQRGYPMEQPLDFIAAGDSFYEWSVQRDSLIRQHFAKRYLPQELYEYEYELNTHGRWITMPPYGYVWIPSGIGRSWRPYLNGRWIWYPICGWTWVPYEPWGWVTFHFGRWHWSVEWGWYWIPSVRWGPAWVRWYRWNDYWAWVPVSYYGYPIVIINNIFYPSYNSDTYPSQSNAITVVHKDRLKAKNLSEEALNRTSLKKLDIPTFQKSTPAVKDIPHFVSVKKLGSEKVLLTHSKDDTEMGTSPSQLPGNASKDKPSPRNLRDPNKERIVHREFGYPSSLREKIDKYLPQNTKKETSSIVERALKYFSSGKSQYIKTRTNPYKSGATSKRITSSSGKSTSSLSRSSKTVSRSRTSSASQTKKTSGTKTVKKKKK